MAYLGCSKWHQKSASNPLSKNWAVQTQPAKEAGQRSLAASPLPGHLENVRSFCWEQNSVFFWFLYVFILFILEWWPSLAPDPFRILSITCQVGSLLSQPWQLKQVIASPISHLNESGRRARQRGLDLVQVEHLRLLKSGPSSQWSKSKYEHGMDD